MPPAAVQEHEAQIQLPIPQAAPAPVLFEAPLTPVMQAIQAEGSAPPQSEPALADEPQREEKTAPRPQLPAPVIAEPREPLRWKGRWGYWRDAAVHILAPTVVDFMVGGMPDIPKAKRAVAEELRKQLSSGLPEHTLLDVAFRDIDKATEPVPSTSFSLTKGARCLFLCDEKLCQVLSCWQRRRIIGGSMEVSWMRTFDTNTDARAANASKIWEDAKSPRSVSVELPASWVLKSGQMLTQHEGIVLNIDQHWYQFANVFGETKTVELAWPRSSFTLDLQGKTLWLLVEFCEPEAARAMVEAIHGRYLYNPGLLRFGAIYPGVCRTANFGELRVRARGDETMYLPPALSMKLGPAVFRLVRCDRGAIDQPAEAVLHHEKTEVVIGRDATCDIPINAQNTSRRHCVINLREEGKYNPTLICELTDTSTNGTLVGGKLFRNGMKTRLYDQDEVVLSVGSGWDVPVLRLEYLAAGVPGFDHQMPTRAPLVPTFP